MGERMIWLLLIPYMALVFGLHGGELITGLNRQFRNLICALPFGVVAYLMASTHYDYPIALISFLCAYFGTNMGFDSWPLWLKGLITFPPLGAALLPLSYWLGNKTKWTNVASEYLSGALYGTALFLIVVA